MTKIKAWLVAIFTLSAISYVTFNGIRLSSEAIRSVKQNTEVKLAKPKKGWLTNLKESLSSEISSFSESIGISTPSASPVASSDTSPVASPTTSPIASPALSTPLPSLFPSSAPSPKPSPIVYPKLAITNSVTTTGMDTRLGFKEVPSKITITANQPLIRCKVSVHILTITTSSKISGLSMTHGQYGKISGNVCVADWSDNLGKDYFGQERITDWYSYSVTGVNEEEFWEKRDVLPY